MTAILALLRFVPLWVWLGAATAIAGGAWHLSAVHSAKNAGRAEVQALWDGARAEAEQAAAADRAAQAETARTAAADYEAQKAAIAANLEDARHDLQKALRRPIRCPAGASLAVGDVVLPADVLAGLRDAAGAARARRDRPAPAEPGRAVR